MTTDYIIPTKKSPVFTAVCEDFGYIEESIYKMWNIKKEGIINHVGWTFACDYSTAVNNLHEWMKENADYVRRCKNIKFKIMVVDGSYDKWGDVITKEVYSITSVKARKVNLV